MILSPSSLDIEDSIFANAMPRVHFQAMNLAESGESVQVLVPFDASVFPSLPENSVYRLLSPIGWQTFVEGVDTLESSMQACDASPVFQAGLVVGSICMRLTIQDGGVNDLDGLQNGVVSHLGAPALEDVLLEEPIVDPFAEFVPGSEKIIVSEAGLVDFYFFVFCLSVFVLRIRRSQFAV